MSETKFTKGPWTSSLMNQHSEYPPIILISGGDGNIVCEISDICVNDADLSFILAAPDMYEALEAYEKAEADIILNANWHTKSGVPRITKEQFYMFKDCQTLRDKALRKARGEAE